MTEHFNKLTPAEAERLFLLAEELGETVQVIGKILRHGYESTHPGGGPTNRELLEHELGDIYAVIAMMAERIDVDLHSIINHQAEKLDRVKRYLHHQP